MGEHTMSHWYDHILAEVEGAKTVAESVAPLARQLEGEMHTAGTNPLAWLKIAQDIYHGVNILTAAIAKNTNAPPPPVVSAAPAVLMSTPSTPSTLDEAEDDMDRRYGPGDGVQHQDQTRPGPSVDTRPDLSISPEPVPDTTIVEKPPGGTPNVPGEGMAEVKPSQNPPGQPAG